MELNYNNMAEMLNLRPQNEVSHITLLYSDRKIGKKDGNVYVFNVYNFKIVSMRIHQSKSYNPFI